MRAKKGEIVCIRAAGQLVGDTLLRSLCVFWDNFPGLRRQLWVSDDTTKLAQGETKEEFYGPAKKDSEGNQGPKFQGEEIYSILDFKFDIWYLNLILISEFKFDICKPFRMFGS